MVLDKVKTYGIFLTIDAVRSKLDQTLLHFDGLCAIDVDQRTNWHHTLIDRWIDENSAGKDNGWESYSSLCLWRYCA